MTGVQTCALPIFPKAAAAALSPVPGVPPAAVGRPRTPSNPAPPLARTARASFSPPVLEGSDGPPLGAPPARLQDSGRGAARPLPRSGRPRGEGHPEGAGPRRPALTRLMLQCHHRHQVVGDVKKGKHGSTRKGKGQLIPQTVHRDDRPPQPKQPRRRIPCVRDEGRGRDGRSRPLFGWASRSSARAPWHLAPARGGGGPRVPGASGARAVGRWAG